MSTAENPLASLYRACGTLGNVGMPGAPVVYFALLVHPSGGQVTGMVHIKQAIEGPNSDITVQNVQGSIKELVWNNQTLKVVSLTGMYYQQSPPPAIVVYQEKFAAHMVLGQDWNGQGGFTYGQHQVDNVPVKSTDC